MPEQFYKSDTPKERHEKRVFQLKKEIARETNPEKRNALQGLLNEIEKKFYLEQQEARIRAAKLYRSKRNKRLVRIFLSGVVIIAVAAAGLYFMGKATDGEPSNAKTSVDDDKPAASNTLEADPVTVAEPIVYDRVTPLSKGQVRAYRYHVDHLTAGEYLLSDAMLKDETGVYGYKKYLNDMLKSGQANQETIDKAYSEAEAGLAGLVTDQHYGLSFYNRESTGSNAYTVAVNEFYAVNFTEFMNDMNVEINDLEGYVSAVNSYDDYLVGIYTDLTQKGMGTKAYQLSSEWPLPMYTILNPASDAYHNRDYRCHTLVQRVNQTGRLEIKANSAT